MNEALLIPDLSGGKPYDMEVGGRPPLPTIIDSTMLVSFRACAAQFHRSHILKRSPQYTSVPLMAGGTFASGIEAYRRAWYADGYSKSACLEIAILAMIVAWGDTDPFPEGKHESRSLDRVIHALISYFNEYPIDKDLFQPHVRADDGHPTIEFGFTVPLDPSEGFPLNPSTGEPFMWAGRSDGLGKFRNLPVFSDEKTTESLGASWSNKWLLRNQFLSYAWCYREMGLPYRSVLVRGVGILKTKISHAEVIIPYPDHLLNRWKDVATYTLHQMVQMWEQNYWPEEFGDACTSWGSCPFTDVCLAADENQDNYLRDGYIHRQWDPASSHNRRTALEEAYLQEDKVP